MVTALAGRDILPAETDFEVTINSIQQWHFSPTNAIPASQFNTHTDLTSTLLHEMGHSLGFISSETVGSGRGLWWNDPANVIFETFLRDANGNALTNRSVYPNNSTALLNAFRSNQVTFRGANAMAANGGQPVPIHSPATYSSSSVSHLADATFQPVPRVGANRLMTTFGTPGDRNHNPGPIAIGIMRDLGWGGVPTPTTPPPAAALRAPSGVTVATPTYQWLPALNASDYLLRVTNASTNAIVSQQWLVASALQCHTGTCTYRPNIVLPAGNYRWDVQARSAGGTGAFSAVMNFTVRPSAPPPVSTPSYPAGIITNLTPSFTWSAASTAADYYLQIVNQANNTAVYQSWITNAQAACVTGTTCRFSRTLSVGSYKWRIMPRNAAGNGPYSAYLSFTVR